MIFLGKILFIYNIINVRHYIRTQYGQDKWQNLNEKKLLPRRLKFWINVETDFFLKITELKKTSSQTPIWKMDRRSYIVSWIQGCTFWQVITSLRTLMWWMIIITIREGIVTIMTFQINFVCFIIILNSSHNILLI